MSAEQFLIKLLSPTAVSPARKSDEAAGYDICSDEDIMIPAGKQCLVSTGLSMQCPIGTYARVAPRSGLAVKGIHVGAGVIDRDYRGEVKVLLVNHGESDFQIAKGDRVAQIVLEKIVTPESMVVETLPETTRGEGGFGSTGAN